MSVGEQAPGRDRLQIVPFGAAAVRALASAIAAAKAGDPLAPVTAVVASSHAGVTLRRRLAGSGGVVNVQFVSFPQLSEVLAAPSLSAELRAPLAPAVHLAAVRAALDDEAGWLREVAHNGTTVQSLAATLDELADAPAAAVDRLIALGPRGRDLSRLARDVRDRCVEFADRRDTTLTAVHAVRGGARSLASVGAVVVHLPRRLGHLELELVDALAQRDLVTVLLGAANDADDASLARLVQALEPSLGRAVVLPADPADGGSVAREIVRAPDPEEEVRHAARRILRALADGVRPDRIAVAARLGDPYFALVHEQFAAAGIPHHGPSGLTLEQSIAGRTLLGGIDLLRDDLPRVDLLRWLRAAPFRQPDGWPLPVDSFERIAREAGIAGGREQWDERLAAATTEIEGRMARLLADLDLPAEGIDVIDPARPVREPPVEGGATPDVAAREQWRVARLDRRARHLATLCEVLEWLGAMGDRLAGQTAWRAHADWAHQFLADLLGPVDELASSSPDLDAGRLESERHAYGRVLTVLDSFRGLDELHQRATVEGFHEVLRAELGRPASPVGRFGHGVFVGTLAELHGADHDLVVVLGMAEGVYPPRGQDDPILPDHLRVRLGPGALAPRRPSRADERRDHDAARASGAVVVSSFARTDTRAQRERLPSRWLLAEVGALAGRAGDEPLAADELDDVGSDGSVPWWTDIPSFASTIEQPAHHAEGALPLVTASEATAVDLLRRRQLEGEAAVIEVPTDRPELARGMQAGVERHAGHFGPYTGRVGPHPALVFDDTRVGSATQFENWAVCPFRYFVRYVLDVRGLDERADADDINALDRGSYMHKVLEDFVGEGIETGVDLTERPFSADELDRLREVAAGVGEQFRAEGKTGRPLLWSLRSEQLLRRLEQILHDDLVHRRHRGVQPVAVELAFGDVRPSGSGDSGADDDAVPPVVVLLEGDRPLAFRGFVDRVDRSPEGDRLVVIDYKTGSDRGYEELKPKKGEARDIVLRGQHLQLALYALAAQSRFGDVPVSAFFWFVESSYQPFRGGDIDDVALARLHEVLGIVVDGIEGGHFPARPGDDGFFGFTNCGFCDFDRICPASRGDQWEALRAAPELRPYRDLAEGPYVPPAVAGANAEGGEGS